MTWMPGHGVLYFKFQGRPEGRLPIITKTAVIFRVAPIYLRVPIFPGSEETRTRWFEAKLKLNQEGGCLQARDPVMNSDPSLSASLPIKKTETSSFPAKNFLVADGDTVLIASTRGSYINNILFVEVAPGSLYPQITPHEGPPCLPSINSYILLRNENSILSWEPPSKPFR